MNTKINLNMSWNEVCKLDQNGRERLQELHKKTMGDIILKTLNKQEWVIFCGDTPGVTLSGEDLNTMPDSKATNEIARNLNKPVFTYRNPSIDDNL